VEIGHGIWPLFAARQKRWRLSAKLLLSYTVDGLTWVDFASGETDMVKTTTDLYRAVFDGSFDGPLVIDGEPRVGLLYPRWDIDLDVEVGGAEPMVEPGGGTSLHNVDGWFGFARCRYFLIPVDTPIPASLKVKKGKSKRTNKTRDRTGYHYQIEPLNRMTQTALMGALDNFARAAVVRQVELAHG
jgi:hypothetical protein